MFTKQFLPRLAAMALFVSMSACTVVIKPNPIPGPDQPARGEITAASKVSGLPGSKVGWGRVTLFAIPVAPVYIQGDDAQLVMARVHAALSKAGYDVAVADGSAAVTGLQLQCHVPYFRFSNYTWLVPLVPTWGEVEMEVSLKNADGQTLWSRKFEGDGFTMNFTDGYSIAANESLDEIMPQLVAAFTEPEFVALVATPGAADSTAAAD